LVLLDCVFVAVLDRSDQLLFDVAGEPLSKVEAFWTEHEATPSDG
jgi:hypothetical protein